MIKKIILLFILIVSSQAIADPYVRSVSITADGGESVRELLTNKLGLSKKFLKNKKNRKKIIKWNPGIKNFKKLQKGERVFLKIPSNIKVKNAKHIANFLQRKRKKKTEFNWKRLDKNMRYYFAMAYAIGTYKEQIVDSNGESFSEQDSPITLEIGRAGGFQYITKSWNIYASSLVSGFTTEVEGAENLYDFGFNYYLGYKNKYQFEVFAGIDYDSFSTYNTNELSEENDLSVVNNRLAFITTGISQSTYILGQKLKAALFGSYSVYGEQSNSKPNTFQGYKYNMLISANLTKKLYLYSFYKLYRFIGTKTSLNTSRYGGGVGYIF